MSDTTKLSADHFESIWSAMDSARDRVTSLADIADAMTILGLHEAARKITLVVNQIADDTIEVQRVLINAQEVDLPPLDLSCVDPAEFSGQFAVRRSPTLGPDADVQPMDDWNIPPECRDELREMAGLQPNRSSYPAKNSAKSFKNNHKSNREA